MMLACYGLHILWSRPTLAHLSSLPPWAACKARTRWGSSLHKPLTLWHVFISSTTALSRRGNSVGVSSHGLGGKVQVRPRLIHETAVSWSIISHSEPGCWEASSPMNARRPWSAIAALNSGGNATRASVVEARATVDKNCAWFRHASKASAQYGMNLGHERRCSFGAIAWEICWQQYHGQLPPCQHRGPPNSQRIPAIHLHGPLVAA